LKWRVCSITLCISSAWLADELWALATVWVEPEAADVSIGGKST
jgi:hypothetical protein